MASTTSRSKPLSCSWSSMGSSPRSLPFRQSRPLSNMLFSSRARGNLVRSFLAVVVSAAVSACSPAALVVVWPPSKWIPAIVAASYTPEKIDRGFRDERPVLAEAISRNFPNEYLAILEEASTQVRRGNIQPLPINSQFGGYAAFATDGALNAAIEAQIAYLLQGVEA